jgi:predicted transcriptional regulator
LSGSCAEHELGQHLGGVAEQTDRERPALACRALQSRQCIVEVGRPLVEVAALDAALDPLQVGLDAQCRASAHRDRQRLRATHAAESGGHH